MAGLVGGFVGLFILVCFLIIFILSLAIAILKIIGVWKVFEKAGKPGWASIIPFYNNWVLFEISGVNPIFSLFVVGGNLLNIIANTLSIIGRSGTQYNYGFAILSLLFSLSSIVLNIAAIVFTVIACLNLAKSFKKEPIFGIGLAFLGFIFYPILGFSKDDEYHELESVK